MPRAAFSPQGEDKVASLSGDNWRRQPWPSGQWIKSLFLKSLTVISLLHCVLTALPGFTRTHQFTSQCASSYERTTLTLTTVYCFQLLQVRNLKGNRVEEASRALATRMESDNQKPKRRVGGAEPEHSLSKAKVRHDGAWSPHGWVAVTCSALRPP